MTLEEWRRDFFRAVFADGDVPTPWQSVIMLASEDDNGGSIELWADNVSQPATDIMKVTFRLDEIPSTIARTVVIWLREHAAE